MKKDDQFGARVSCTKKVAVQLKGALWNICVGLEARKSFGKSDLNLESISIKKNLRNSSTGL